ncbi:hypothetical protein [Syntrophotalea carbinolica]|uniref:hypothetical protein n=1 Tax=Syntrophotalea carbinolica TaxID=19 RepID=UPI001FE20676|nr:hypothetical protein [Syntrophotalea carbinolica]
MDQYEHVRTAHRVYGQTISEIARITGHSRNTIRKALSESHSGYSPRQQQPYPVLGPFMKTIDDWLSEDKDRPRKQRHTAQRVFDRLVAERGFTGSASNVRKYSARGQRAAGNQCSAGLYSAETRTRSGSRGGLGHGHGHPAGSGDEGQVFLHALERFG